MIAILKLMCLSYPDDNFCYWIHCSEFLLLTGNQTRPFIFDLEIKKPELLYERVIEVDERVRLYKGDPNTKSRMSQHIPLFIIQH
jgi:hypothetical protein